MNRNDPTGKKKKPVTPGRGKRGPKKSLSLRAEGGKKQPRSKKN